jgi:hypothetical protein
LPSPRAGAFPIPGQRPTVAGLHDQDTTASSSPVSARQTPRQSTH